MTFVSKVTAGRELYYEHRIGATCYCSSTLVLDVGGVWELPPWLSLCNSAPRRLCGELSCLRFDLCSPQRRRGAETHTQEKSDPYYR